MKLTPKQLLLIMLSLMVISLPIVTTAQDNDPVTSEETSESSDEQNAEESGGGIPLATLIGVAVAVGMLFFLLFVRAQNSITENPDTPTDQ